MSFNITLDEDEREVYIYKGSFNIYRVIHGKPNSFTIDFDEIWNMFFSELYEYETGRKDNIVFINHSTKLTILSKPKCRFSNLEPFINSFDKEHKQDIKIRNKGEIAFRFYQYKGEMFMKVISIKIVSAYESYRL